VKSCPYIPKQEEDSSSETDFNDAREEMDPEEEGTSQQEEEDDIESRLGSGSGSHSAECGCIAGPKYPDIDVCDVHPLF